MAKQIINTPNAPKAIGPYSQAVKAGNMVFLSGQIALDPVTGIRLAGGIESQTKRIMENIKVVLEAAGGKMENIVKTVIYLKRIEDYKFANAVYEKFFTGNFPARSTVAVHDLPKNCDVEIDVTAILD